MASLTRPTEQRARRAEVATQRLAIDVPQRKLMECVGIAALRGRRDEPDGVVNRACREQLCAAIHR